MENKIKSVSDITYMSELTPHPAIIFELYFSGCGVNSPK